MAQRRVSTGGAIDRSPDTLSRVRQAVARARQNDREAIEYLYVVYARNVYGYVRSIVQDEHEAEDVTQHVFAKLITHLDRYDDRGVPFFAWLLRMAHNAAIDHLRRNRLVPTEVVLDPSACRTSDRDRLEAVREALSTLPQDQRAVVFLRHVVGLSPGEIAEQMGRTESSIHGLHHRARRTLRRELSNERRSSETGTTARLLVAC